MSDLNERAIKATVPGDVLRDAAIKGLHLRCFAQRKSFYLYFRTKAGVERKPKIGDYGSITLAQARKIANDMLVDVAAGGDPSQKRADARAEPTLKDLWDEYWKRHGKAKKSSSDDEWLWNKLVEPKLAAKRLSAITYTVLSDFMEGQAERPIAANRALALLSKMLNFARTPLQWTTGESPTTGVKRYKETKRKRYMRGDEAPRVAALLHAEAKNNPASVAFIYLLILTGARKGEIAAARWSQLDGNRIVLDEHKTDNAMDERVIYLPPPAMEVIERLPRTSGTITGIQSPRKLWEKIRTAAGCPDLRLHDLRHSFASAAISAGMTLAQIGELLGHKDSQTTKRYAHLMEEAQVAAATAATDVVLARMKQPA
ncbi:integrase protein [Burkholderia lata]|uniref:Integrase protein n=1 Tax=Burkholderia lata (strain ATCC 17760 / DSM 23089 / LMG 22485 / NCIMB 9086 / R18194 / 383) TaxID=482957 RepID=A0A6P2WKN8_BURL3|nr:site-specific integrase [Burkholderia lata]VWC95422.1 integrase protein [Burkholderia lata]